MFSIGLADFGQLRWLSTNEAKPDRGGWHSGRSHADSGSSSPPDDTDFTPRFGEKGSILSWPPLMLPVAGPRTLALLLFDRVVCLASDLTGRWTGWSTWDLHHDPHGRVEDHGQHL